MTVPPPTFLSSSGPPASLVAFVQYFRQHIPHDAAGYEYVDPIHRLDGYRYSSNLSPHLSAPHASPFITASYPSNRFCHLFLLRYQEQQRGRQQVLPPVRACASDQGPHLHGSSRWQRRGGRWPLIATDGAPAAGCRASAPWGGDGSATQLWVAPKEEFRKFCKGRTHLTSDFGGWLDK